MPLTAMVDALDEEPPATPAPKSKLPLILAVCTALWVGTGLGMFIMHRQLKQAAVTTQAAQPAGEGAAEPAVDAGGLGHVVTMSSFVVNLLDEAGGSDESHYLRCTVAVDLASADMEKVLEQRTPKIRNSVLIYLSGLKVSQTQGVEQKRKLLVSMREQISDVMGKGAVRDVYLTEFVIQ